MKSLLTTLFLVSLLVCSLPETGSCTEEYSLKTGKACVACHLNPAGGGELTTAGKAFAASGTVPDWRAAPNTSLRLLRLAAGYLHMITAFLWFGTILYVHLVLKPAYASHGLPRGEVLVGLGSMVVMAVSGAVLTIFRITSPAMLLQSRFGILLTIKIGLFLTMVCSALFVVLVIGPRLRARKSAQTAGPKQTMTTAELAQCDGKDGRPACFAYQGRIFDASASRLWKDGEHMRRHPAGTDLTEALKLAPHDEDKVLAMPLVGSLLETGISRERPLHEKVFFFMAYMNLTMVFCIVLILALWRWGW
jgi:predicted heme/steroid binding protein